jgi:prophage antirepressor-like protein
MSEMALFEERPVRRVFHNEEWWFVLTDIVSALTDSPAPSDYLKKLRRRDPSLADVFKGGGQFVPPLALPFETEGGMQRLQCWNVPGVLRLIQSIPSPKAEPFNGLRSFGLNGDWRHNCDTTRGALAPLQCQLD